MEIILTYGGQSERLNPDLKGAGWADNKKGQRHRRLDTSLKPPFDKLFVKHWYRHRAPAHELLRAARGKDIPGTPRVFGVGNQGSNFVYVFERMPDSYKLLRKLLEGGNGEYWLAPGLLLQLINQADRCFYEIGRDPYRHVYTDFCVKNIMVDQFGNNPVLIDLDSAWSYEFLKNQNGKGDSGHFDICYWCLWHEYVLSPTKQYADNAAEGSTKL